MRVCVCVCLCVPVCVCACLLIFLCVYLCVWYYARVCARLCRHACVCSHLCFCKNNKKTKLKLSKNLWVQWQEEQVCHIRETQWKSPFPRELAGWAPIPPFCPKPILFAQFMCPYSYVCMYTKVYILHELADWGWIPPSCQKCIWCIHCHVFMCTYVCIYAH